MGAKPDEKDLFDKPIKALRPNVNEDLSPTLSDDEYEAFEAAAEERAKEATARRQRGDSAG